MLSASNISKHWYVSFCPCVLIFSWFGSSIPSVICRFLFFTISIAHFSMPNSIPISRVYIFTAYIRVSDSFSFLANSLMSSMYIRWLMFSCELLSWYPLVYFLSMWLSGIITITNSNGERESPWNIPLWIFASATLFTAVVNSTLKVPMVFSIKFVTSSDMLYIILRQFIIQLFGTISCAFL